MNQIFGYQILPEGLSSSDNVFEGTQLVLPSTSFNCNNNVGQLRIFAEPNSHLQCSFSQKHKSRSYIWGIPAHPEITTKDIPEWCLNVVHERNYGCFKELIGPFVAIIDEPDRHRITFITDILGVRPMFIGNHNNRVVFGSKVWPIYKAGLSTGAVDYDAVSSWIAYGFNCTNGTLFSDLRRLPPGSVVTLQDGQYTEIPYAEFNTEPQKIEAKQVVEDLHSIVSSTVKILLSNHNKVSFALSGGYDSRYLLALSSSLTKTSAECYTVSNIEEAGIVRQVADTLKVPLKKCSINGSIWDLYDEVFQFTADGFPISKFVTFRIAQEHSGIPMVNGFMGDSLMRGSKDTFLGKYETEWGCDLADVLQRKHLFTNFKIFRKNIAKRIKMRARIPMEEAVQKGSSIGKVFAWADFYYRQRHYTSNNFMQHLENTEALLPFYSWELLAYKVKSDYKVFNENVYRMIFHTYFPELAKIPFASDLPKKRYQHVRVARCTKEWARQIFPLIFNKKWLSLLAKRRCVPIDIAGIAGLQRAESSIFLLEKLYLLEKSARDADLDFDWECI